MTDDRDDGGRDFGPYRLGDPLGRGASGEVRRAVDSVSGRTVALKRLNAAWAEDPSLRERFWRDTELAARFASEHVIAIHDFGEIDGVLFVDMHLVRGVDLADALAMAPNGLDRARVVDIVEQVAVALDATHLAGLVHGGVRPTKVLLEPTESGEHVSVVDFGIHGRAAIAATRSGAADYLAPELCDGSGRASRASDVYAVGCVLFAMLTGRPPFQGHPAVVAQQHLHQRPPPPSTVRPDLAAFDDVLETALAKEPDRRPSSVGALAAAARGAARSVDIPLPGTPSPAPAVPAAAAGTPPIPTLVDAARPGRPRPGARGWTLIGAAVLVLALVVVVGASFLRGSAPPPSSAAPPTPPLDTAPHGLHLPSGAATSGDVVVSRDGRSAYALQSARAGSLTMLDTATGTVRASVPVGAFPEALDVSPDGSRVYVANFGENGSPGSTVSVIDVASARVVGTIAVGLFPNGLALSQDGARVYVTNNGTIQDPSGTVSVIDTATDTVLATVPVGRAPTNPAVSPDSRLVFVPNAGLIPGTVSVIDAASDTVIRTLPVDAASPRSVAVSPDERRIYVACPGPDNPGPGAPPPSAENIVEKVDLASGTSTPLVTPGLDRPHDLKLSPDGSTLLVSDNGDHGGSGSAANAYLLVDTATGALRRSLILGGAPKETAVAADGPTAYVAVTNPGDVWQVPLA